MNVKNFKVNNKKSKKENKIEKILISLLIITIVVIIIILDIINIKKEKKEDEIALTLKENLSTEFLSDVKVSSFIENLNGTLIDDYKIDTTSLGTKNVNVKYKNERGKKKNKSYEINVVDTEKPKIFLSDTTISVKKGYDKSLTNLFFSGDSCDPTPIRTINGEYDLNTPGKYNLTFEIKDASGNIATKDFILRVYEPSTSSSNNTNNSSTTKNRKNFSDIMNNYCKNTTLNDSSNKSNENKNNTINNENTSNNKNKIYNKAGIDVSSWQGNIDWKKVKEAGCDFAFIRVGSQYGRGGEIHLDKYFEANIENAISNNINVGIYFYSCAQNIKEAEEQAKWVIDKVKDYKISLPIAFDWEEWNSFADYNLSFYGINNVAKSFINICKNNGYNGMLYSSKNYLVNIWYPEMFENVWLAQYASIPTYENEYNYWQMCNTGKIDGIDGDVDIDLAL